MNYFLCPGVKAVIVHSVFAGFVLLTIANEKETISVTDQELTWFSLGELSFLVDENVWQSRTL